MNDRNTTRPLVALQVLAVLSILVSLLRCSSFQTKYYSDRDLEQRDWVFPVGVYTHQITVIPHEGKEYRFLGVVRIKDDLIEVTGLSRLHTTLFRIKEDRVTQKVQSEIFYDAIKKHDSHIKKYYQVISTALKSRLTPEEKEKLQSRQLSIAPLSREVEFDQKKLKIQFYDYDKHQIPTAMKIEYAKLTILIKVGSYEI